MNSSQAVTEPCSGIQNCTFWSNSFDPEPVKQVYWSYVFTCTLCSLLSIPTTILNLLVVMAIYKTKTLHKPYNMYLCNLAVSDFAVGFLAEPIYIGHTISEIKGDVTSYCVTGAVSSIVSFTTVGVSLFTLVAMSVDRFLSINSPLKYRTIVTSYRVGMVMLLLWGVCATGSSLRMWLSVKIFFFGLAFFTIISLIVIFVANIKAFRSLKAQRQNIMQRMQVHQGNDAMKLARSKKFLITMLYVLGLVILCFVPFGCITILQTIRNGGMTSSTRAAWNVSNSIGYMNSSLNPILYCLRIPDIANAVKATIKSSLQKSGNNCSSKVTRITPAHTDSRQKCCVQLPTIPTEPMITDDKNTSYCTGITTSL